MKSQARGGSTRIPPCSFVLAKISLHDEEFAIMYVYKQKPDKAKYIDKKKIETNAKVIWHKFQAYLFAFFSSWITSFLITWLIFLCILVTTTRFHFWKRILSYIAKLKPEKL
jgi:hypothetical protein